VGHSTPLAVRSGRALWIVMGTPGRASRPLLM
jgi:hypothetical protein